MENSLTHIQNYVRSLVAQCKALTWVREATGDRNQAGISVEHSRDFAQ